MVNASTALTQPGLGAPHGADEAAAGGVTRLTAPAYWKFESISLQRRVMQTIGSSAARISLPAGTRCLAREQDRAARGRGGYSPGRMSSRFVRLCYKNWPFVSSGRV